MRALLRKEFRAQRPFGLLIVFLVALDLTEFTIGAFPDTHSLGALLNAHSAESEAGFVLLVLATALALALLPREKDEGTLEFLDGLPCTRGRIFAAKAITGVSVLGLYPLLGNVSGLVLHRLGRTSLDPEWPWSLLGGMLAIEWFVCAALVGVGLALSFFRRFAFFMLGVLVGAYLALDAGQVAWVHHFDFTAALRYTFRHGEIDVAWTQLGVLGAMGTAGYGIAALAFQMQGDRAARVFGWIERHHLRGPLAAMGTAAMIAVWIAVGARIASMSESEEDEGDEPAAVYREWQTSRLHAGGYIFLYPSNLRERAAALGERASEVHEKVRAFFAAEPVGEIVADLDSSLRHVAATAEWKRVNMSITHTRKLPEQLAVLGHETTHVYIDAISDLRLKRAWAAARWWHEGLASYVEFRFFREPGEVAQLRRVAAGAHARKASEFELLVDDDAWRAKHDPDLAYSLGEVFFESLIAEHGDEAPGKILRALARKDAPEDVEGLDLWRDAFQACGWDMSRTISSYYERLQALATGEHREFVESLPKLRGRVLAEEDELKITVIVTGELPEGAELRCRVRRFATDGDSDYFWLDEEKPREFSAERSWLGEGEFWYQLGLAHPGAQFTIWEDWHRARVK